MSTDYKKLEETFPHCISCTSRLAQDTCRFQHVRTFLLDNENKINGFYFADHEGDDPPTPLPPAGDVTLDRCLAQQTKVMAARALASGIRDELESMRRSGVVYMPMGGKATCDRCRGSIFLSSRMCILCGRALCTECFAQVELLTVLPPGGSQRELDGRWEAFSVRNPKFLDCLKASIRHSATDFVLVSKINRATVATALSDMEHLLRYEPSETAAPRASDAVISDHTSTSGSSKANCISNGSNFDLPTRTIQQFKESDLTEVIFRTLWAQGNPLLVTELVRKLKMNWSPEYFAQKFDSEHCNTIECQTEVNRWITVNEFFANFGRYDGREQCWKLQNFPPPSVKLTLSDFRSALPELYADLAQALPLPNYVCAEGVQNIASHFLFNSDEPDLGPTMDVAYANRTVAHSKGSVRLHMDRADTLNIIVFAAPDPDGREGRAAWDLFRAQDSDKVQQFLLTKLRTHRPPNPMHTNQAYLDDAARHDLWQQYGVKSYRVYQKAGDVVFIPAGCAYQVCNLSDCISVTTGFVPAEGIKRCEELAREVTLFNRTNNWKNPVLPLRDIMWAAWLACCRQEKLLASN
ncbi:hypothetical protein B0H17DRAFT_1283731 [Mycena rosella]|uniref:JmjC domain-containing protein n=1 Tax=Mycena rosella TaxID=1033263 RepID=A0AAD7DJ63_MYCRO|nr:hypothetical protein B0H17DRAFT_1283731 [Mycena rosella]